MKNLFFLYWLSAYTVLLQAIQSIVTYVNERQILIKCVLSLMFHLYVEMACFKKGTKKIDKHRCFTEESFILH